jgi:hypothetical protein
MFLVLVKTDAAGVQRCLPRLSTVTPLTAEQLELGATTDLQQAQLFSATPISLAGQTVLCLQPTPPPGLEDWQAHAVSLRLPSDKPSHDQGGYEDART